MAILLDETGKDNKYINFCALYAGRHDDRSMQLWKTRLHKIVPNARYDRRA